MRKSIMEKAKLVETYKEKISKSNLVIFFNFTGLDAYPMSQLRAEIKDMGGEILVGKNTLFYRAFMDTVMADHRDVLVGPTALVFAYRDPVVVAKRIYEVSKELDSTDPLSHIKGGYMQGRFLTPQEVKVLAELPPKEVLISQLMGALQAPLLQLILALKSAPQKLVLVLKAIEEKKSQ
ncbi:ribosomal protein L10 [Thermocrinis albus DSM 14484]|uniref:Large ribosomal subunit protein uL10 n=1 Tax=Thermocrinis albus (strain DSM 14484 / JCM 11386 / HI 11/12) TaxID=638303 RepID=D3SQ24_THEAH|nr:50S ribosomal protein L10 [Thermocrinis albus]ADC89261.1 ribosomal protein L10 [Thermocrinis albus DSM 14484]